VILEGKNSFQDGRIKYKMAFKRNEKSMDNFIDYHNKKYFSAMEYRKEEKKDIDISQKIKVSIKSIGSKGDGIAKFKNYVVIIPDVKVGDEVEVIITNIKDNLVFAKKSE
jgi:predicted RNA-binding protein with TRAM domain